MVFFTFALISFLMYTLAGWYLHWWRCWIGLMPITSFHIVILDVLILNSYFVKYIFILLWRSKGFRRHWRCLYPDVLL